MADENNNLVSDAQHLYGLYMAYEQAKAAKQSDEGQVTSDLANAYSKFVQKYPGVNPLKVATAPKIDADYFHKEVQKFGPDETAPMASVKPTVQQQPANVAISFGVPKRGRGRPLGSKNKKKVY